MSDPIITKCFSRIHCKRFGCCAILLYFIILVGSPKRHLDPLSLTGDDLKVLMVDDGIRSSNKTIAICTSPNYCELEGDIRIDAKSSTILIVTPPDAISNSTYSSTMEPYPRPNSRRVKKWRLTLSQHDHDVPICTQHHTHPAILFSNAGFTGAKTAAGNYFHDFADLLFPLFMTAFEFRGKVHFLATDHKPRWIHKYTRILNKLTEHEILDIDGETLQVHCYNRMQIGVKFYNVLLPFPSPLTRSPSSMRGFRQLLREAYSLKRASAGVREPLPRLMIIDRKRSRVLTNARQVSKMATEMGFEVVVAEAERSTNVSRFAEAVNSCDVLVGVHGAGLTNMLFLPENSVVIQILPFGDVEWYAKTDFGDPAPAMNLRYLEYKITAEESSLSRKYSRDHPVLRDPESFRGRDEFWQIYIHRQNVTVDLGRFKGTLVKALQLLRR